ncbi:MAG TPA: NADH-quinone oxidoreductase subunit L [Terriglobales bacterium]|nr:NADH-quinone oxidoreductase subunit L [Terriglobales bacterium]
MFFLDKIWIIPLLPAFGAAMMFLFGRKLSGIAPRPRYAEAHGHEADPHGPSPADTAHDVHAAHGPAGSHDAPHVHERHEWVNGICVGAVVLAFIMAVGCVWEYTHTWTAQHPGQPFEKVVYTWLGTGDAEHAITYTTHTGAAASFNIEAGFLLDPLSSIWLLFVTGVGMLIHIYSMGYMAHEGGYYRFFGYLNLFMFSMLTLILGNNYVMMFVGWEGVGLCSYLLIGFYFLRHSASTAANKAFITNRVGDAGVLLGTFTIFWLFGTVKFTAVTEMARSGIFPVEHTFGILTFATLMLFVGACGKSAQLPLYVWLPDAMEGPTPVSALIHAATMVTAGVYMVARSNALFTLTPISMTVVAIVGCLTALFAASIGLVQNDIKRVLAYSTVSQLGYMFLALGIGAFAAGVFHVFTHAFFKALLFLGSGSVIHAMSGEQDMRNMGGLWKKIPTTAKTMLIGTIAIAGFPPLAGFFSKDEILWQAWSTQGGAFRVLWGLGFATALMTSFYMFRLMYLTFWSPKRMSHEVEHHVHESPKSMTVPLMVLAFCSIFAGFLGVPHALGGSNMFHRFLEPVFIAESHAPATHAAAGGEQAAHATAAPAEHSEHANPVEYVLMIASVGAAALGLFAAGRAYKKAEKGYTEPINAVSPFVYQTLLNKYYVDEGYDYLFTGRRKIAGNVRLGAMGAGEALWAFDANVIDGGVNGAGWMTRAFGRVSSWWDKWIIDGVGVNGPAFVARGLSYPVRLVQWGLVQWYALVMVGGLVSLGIYFVVRLGR